MYLLYNVKDNFSGPNTVNVREEKLSWDWFYKINPVTLEDGLGTRTSATVEAHQDIVRQSSSSVELNHVFAGGPEARLFCFPSLTIFLPAIKHSDTMRENIRYQRVGQICIDLATTVYLKSTQVNTSSGIAQQFILVRGAWL